jgi:hypothetical protein
MARRASRSSLPCLAVLLAPILMTCVVFVALAQAGHAPAIPWETSRSAADPTGKQPRLFQKAVTYDSGGGEASSVAVADLNGDGKADIVVTNCGGCYGPPGIGQNGSVGVLLGNGDGTFEPAVTYDSGGLIPVFVAVADLNGDGKPDLAVVNRNSANIGVLLGNGDGTFQPAMTYGSGDGSFSPLLVVVADLNGDGKPDLVVANFCSDDNCDGSVGVLLGYGDGTFQPAVTYPSGGGYSSAIAVADVNGDGNPDVLVSNEYTVGVLLGNGDGSFQTAVAYSSGGISIPPAASRLAVADVNGDSKLDLIVESSQCCGSADGVVGVLLGNGDGTFQPVVTYESGKGGWGTSVAVGDVSLDGKPDIVATDECAGADCSHLGLVAVLVGNGDGTFQAAQSYSSGGFLTNSVAVADVNGDRRLDLVVANLCADNASDCTRASVGVLLRSPAGATRTRVETSMPRSHPFQAVTFTASVTSKHGPIPDGELVTFYSRRTLLGSAPLTGGVAAFTYTFVWPGSTRIHAVYAGDAMFKPSADVVAQRVFKWPVQVQVVSSQNPSKLGQPVTFTITVSSGGPVPTRFVTLYQGKKQLASLELVDGTASFTYSKFKLGPHTIFAIYWSDDYNRQNKSPYMKQYVVR